MREVVVDLAQLRFLAAVLDEVLAHRHQRRGAARGKDSGRRSSSWRGGSTASSSACKFPGVASCW